MGLYGAYESGRGRYLNQQRLGFVSLRSTVDHQKRWWGLSSLGCTPRGLCKIMLPRGVLRSVLLKSYLTCLEGSWKVLRGFLREKGFLEGVLRKGALIDGAKKAETHRVREYDPIWCESVY